MKNPPNSAQFDPDTTSAVVDGRIAERREKEKNNSVPAPNQQANTLAGNLVNASVVSTGVPSTGSLTTRKIGPRVSLGDFCANYGLSDDIKDKLSTQRITGPHALFFITDTDLRGTVGLTIGELADLRDAEEQWSSM